MTSEEIVHDDNSPSCHHCHITAPIPLSELIRTHPLRSVLAKKNEEIEKANENYSALPKTTNKEKTGSVRSGHGEIKTNLQSAIVNHYSKSLKGGGEGGSSSTTASRSKKSNENILVRPVHSYLHHESEGSQYNKADVNSKLENIVEGSSNVKTDPYLSTSSTSTSEDVQPPLPPRDYLQSSSKTPDIILNAKNLEIQKETVQNKSNTSTLIKKIKEYKVLRLKDEETQTPRESVLSRASYNKSRDSSSESSISFIKSLRSRKKSCNVFVCSLPSGLLFAGYGLLIVIGIVVAVALSQRERRISLQNSPLPRRPVAFPGASATFEPASQKVSRVRTQQSRPRIRTIARVAPQQNVIAAPAPPPPPPQVPTQQDFRVEDFDYIEDAGFDDADFIFPDQNAARPAPAPVPVNTPAPLPAFRPIPVQAPVPVPVRQSNPAPRRGGTPSTFQQEFNISPNEGEIPRGQKEPEVKIIKSWSNRNADGTFSYGYINTDGSYKNETKGTDCVVRGVYGYVDEATGETVSFPYQSGNPCDPNEPDYFVDYDSGTLNINEGGVRKKINVGTLPRRRVSTSSQ